MKGYIKDQNIILTEPLPEGVQDGDEVEVIVTIIPKQSYPFPTFPLGVKQEYLNRENLYEPDQDSVL